MPLSVNSSKGGPQGALVGFPLQHLSRLLLRVSYARHGMSPPSASVDCALVVPKAEGKFSALDNCRLRYTLGRLIGSQSSASPILVLQAPEGKAESRFPILLTNL